MIEHYLNYQAEIWLMLGSAVIIAVLTIKYLEYSSNKSPDSRRVQPKNDSTNRNYFMYAFGLIVNQGKTVSLFLMTVGVDLKLCIYK